jgi:hypothetical protein
MSFPLSRVMSAATAAYGAYALAEPRHLGNAVDPENASDYDLLAHTYGVRDLIISGFGLLGRSDLAVSTSMRIRILCDVGDGVLLAMRAKHDQARAKVLGVTLGWASLNALALRADRRRSGLRS